MIYDLNVFRILFFVELSRLLEFPQRFRISTWLCHCTFQSKSHLKIPSMTSHKSYIGVNISITLSEVIASENFAASFAANDIDWLTNSSPYYKLHIFSGMVVLHPFQYNLRSLAENDMQFLTRGINRHHPVNQFRTNSFCIQQNVKNVRKNLKVQHLFRYHVFGSRHEQNRCGNRTWLNYAILKYKIQWK